MKKKDVKDLFGSTVPELYKKMSGIILDLKKIQIDSSMGKLKNTNLIGSKKKDIARIKTVLKAKEIIQK